MSKRKFFGKWLLPVQEYSDEATDVSPGVLPLLSVACRMGRRFTERHVRDTLLLEAYERWPKLHALLLVRAAGSSAVEKVLRACFFLGCSFSTADQLVDGKVSWNTKEGGSLFQALFSRSLLQLSSPGREVLWGAAEQIGFPEQFWQLHFRGAATTASVLRLLLREGIDAYIAKKHVDIRRGIDIVFCLPRSGRPVAVQLKTAPADVSLGWHPMTRYKHVPHENEEVMALKKRTWMGTHLLNKESHMGAIPSVVCVPRQEHPWQATLPEGWAHVLSEGIKELDSRFPERVK